MMKKLALLLLAAAITITPVLGSSENAVDRVLSVKDDYSFEPGKAFVTLRIEESHANEFGSDPVSFKLTITNAKWFEMGDPVTADPAAMDNDSTMIAGAALEIQRLTDRELEITLDRSLAAASEEAWWRIPIYAEVTSAGIATLEVDGLDGPVTGGTYKFATVLGDNYLYSGYRFTPENPQWLTVREPQAGAYAGAKTLRLVLENGTWFPESDTRMGPQAMLKAAAVSGIEAGSVAEIRRIDDATLELILQRGIGSSLKAQGVWSVPMYFTVDEFGLAKVSVTASPGGAGIPAEIGAQKITEPIRYIRTVTLTLNQPEIVMKQGSEQRATPLDAAPVNPAGSTLVPVRGVFEQLGATVQWDSAQRTVTIRSESRQILLHADSAAAQVDGKTVTLLQKPIIMNGRLLIPLRSVSEQLGFGVEWIEAAQQITIRQD